MGWVLGIVLAVLVIGFLVSLVYFGGMYMMGTNPYYYPRPFFGFLFFPFGLIAFFFLVFVVFRLAFWPGRRGYHGRWGSWNDADEILRRRYARGEITKEQFEQMRRDLDQSK